MGIKLISVNIERDKHLDRVIPFIQSEKPDVLCLQEVCQKDLPLFRKLMGDQFRFSRARRDTEDDASINGEAVFSRLPVREWFYYQYAGPDHDMVFDMTSQQTRSDTAIRAVTGCEILQGRNTFRIATTHFTWTERGEADVYQKQDVRAMLDAVRPLGDLIFCGDFNAPRGGETFSFIAQHYKDAIPKRYKTSIDIALHRSGKDRPDELADKMVDGLFLTDGYYARGVRLESGVSDHMAVVAKIHVTGTRMIDSLWDLIRW
ncbi:endonuclease/exonuclease/phosphatase family protein [Candidatus Parcubacteria bacterium]|nr:MAG: endonuclease/exonuclease/phosphatase family protein [Candidatus Parcubacteria bacterium]